MTPEIKNRIDQIRRGEVPEGYTKVRKALIPHKWKYCPIRDVATISSGSTPVRNNPEYWDGGIPWVTTGELENGHVVSTVASISKKAVKNLNLKMYPKGTLLMAMYGQGKTRGTVAMLEIDATVNQACAAITPKKGKADFLFFQLQNAYGDIRKLSNTGNQENLNADIIKAFHILWAPDSEQQKIAEILTAQDKVIELKEKLIAEKQRQKKYLMQQLLTGKKRLSGFNRKWEKIRAEAVFKNVISKNHNCALEVLSVTQDRGVIPRSQIEKDIKYDDGSLPNYKAVNRGNFVISLRSFQGGIEYSKYEGIVSPAYTVLSNKVPIDEGYYQYYFKSADYIKRLQVAVYGIRDGKQIGYDDFGFIKIYYPPIEEQTAIARILITADQEIDLLQQSLEQEKQKKKALMQLLLTGIVRVNV